MLYLQTIATRTQILTCAQKIFGRTTLAILFILLTKIVLLLIATLSIPGIKNNYQLLTTLICYYRRSWEQQLVEEITTPSGVRIAPSASQLAQFSFRCESFPETQRLFVFQCLLEKLDSDSPHMQQVRLFLSSINTQFSILLPENVVCY